MFIYSNGMSQKKYHHQIKELTLDKLIQLQDHHQDQLVQHHQDRLIHQLQDQLIHQLQDQLTHHQDQLHKPYQLQLK
jgi:hypothetical protein